MNIGKVVGEETEKKRNGKYTLISYENSANLAGKWVTCNIWL